MKYAQHMTTEYDARFEAAGDLLWNPWVGRDYHKTGILILGISTDMRGGTEDWTLNLAKNGLSARDASRSLVAWVHKADETPFQYRDSSKSFKMTAKMFIEGAGAQYDEHTCAVFWELVAFNNYYQVVVAEIGNESKQTTPADKDRAKRALDASIDIIKPTLVLAWTTEIWDLGLAEHEYMTCNEKIGRSWPRFSKLTPPIAGMQHPSRAFSPTAWLEFLRTHPKSKQPVGELLEALKQRLK